MMLGALGKKPTDTCLGIEGRLRGFVGHQFNGAD
jgi:hypothetical protein